MFSKDESSWWMALLGCLITGLLAGTTLTALYQIFKLAIFTLQLTYNYRLV